jgi:hypothetical protein
VNIGRASDGRLEFPRVVQKGIQLQDSRVDLSKCQFFFEAKSIETL